MKLQDKATIAISLAALILSIITAVSSKIASEDAKAAIDRKNIYSAFHLGQQATIIYAFARSDQKNPAVDGGTGDKLADDQIAMRTFAAQGYAQSLNVAPDRFVTFRNLLESGQPINASDTFSLLNSSLEASGGPKARAAYELGWQTALVALGFSNPQTSDAAISAYPKLRGVLESDLKVVGINHTMPQTVSDISGFLTAINGVIAVLNSLKP